MRIVYMLTSLGIGGAERLSLSLAERMAQRGHTVSVLALRPRTADEWATEMPVERLDMRKNPVSFIAAILRARRILREFRPDLIHSHSFHANMMARLLKLLVPAPAILSTVHNIHEGGRLRMFAYRLSDPLSRRTTAVSQKAADRFIALRAVPARKCTVISNAIDLAAWTPNAARRAQTRRALAANSDFIWLAAGRLAPSKDYPNLLRAFALLRASRSEPHFKAQLWIAGQGTGAQLSALSSLAANLGVDRSMQWLGLRRDIPALLDAADAFVLSSAWEGMPLVLAEAMAMEKPLVATDAGGVREMMEDAGAIVPLRDSEALAEAMLALMRQSPEAQKARCCAARNRMQAQFNLDTRADQWEGLYRTVLRGGAK